MSKNISPVTILGLLLIIIGVANPYNLLATLLIDTTNPVFSTTGSYPSSTDINSPTIISKGVD